MVKDIGYILRYGKKYLNSRCLSSFEAYLEKTNGIDKHVERNSHILVSRTSVIYICLVFHKKIFISQ